MSEREPLLEVRDLTVSFASAGGGGGRVCAVDGVSLSLHQGRMLAVVGESGSGKSVTALSILRLLPAPPQCAVEQGQIQFDGRDLLRISVRAMLQVRGGGIAMIFQEPMTSLNPVYTIGEQIIEAIQRHQRTGRRGAQGIAITALAEVGIVNASQRLHAYPHQFSGGMRQRVMIAMALACRPKILLADEPTTALDVTIAAQILDLLQRLQRERGLAIMLITHDLGVVAQRADDLCVMYGGRVVEYGLTRAILAEPLHPYTRALLACRPRLSAGTGAGASSPAARSARLKTIADVMSEASSHRLPGGVRPWWPVRGDAARGGGDAYALREVAPGRRVGCLAPAAGPALARKGAA